eukprot:CAMPEP_0176458732 /NCGR_PEP_ID=MMETSP0127-20121128/32796_1 /TAXON_ID=938130 /ORGANISM="Platyophrya macrostoma, Strain WH" /LENGTH=239 /DNA_ID=CAMNT_0017849413 /DNA_START=119 /DNA_END=838 /DNA_ORIENTATION=-
MDIFDTFKHIIYEQHVRDEKEFFKALFLEYFKDEYTVGQSFDDPAEMQLASEEGLEMELAINSIYKSGERDFLLNVESKVLGMAKQMILKVTVTKDRKKGKETVSVKRIEKVTDDISEDKLNDLVIILHGQGSMQEDERLDVDFVEFREGFRSLFTINYERNANEQRHFQLKDFYEAVTKESIKKIVQTTETIRDSSDYLAKLSRIHENDELSKLRSMHNHLFIPGHYENIHDSSPAKH